MAREGYALVLLQGHSTLRAGYSIQESFALPSITLDARVGIPSTASGWQDYLVGEALSTAQQADTPDLKVVRPIHMNRVVDWGALLALWHHVAVIAAGGETNDSPLHGRLVLLALPSLSRGSLSIATQLVFEHLGAAGVAVVETSQLSSYGYGAPTGTVVDIRTDYTLVQPVSDASPLAGTAAACPVGARHCHLYLAHLIFQEAGTTLSAVKRVALRALSTDGNAPSEESVLERTRELLVELSERLASSGALGGIDDPEGADAATHGAAARKAAAETGELDVAAILVQGQERELINGATPGKDAGNKDGDSDQEEDPTSTTVILRGVQIPVGPIRFRWAEPLLNPAVLNDVESLTDSLSELPSIEPLPVPGIPPTPKRNRHWPPNSRFAVSGASAWEPASLPGEKVDWSTAPSVAETLHLAVDYVGEPDTERRPQLLDAIIFSGASQGTRGLSTLLLQSFRSYVLGDDEPPPEAAQSKQKGGQKPQRMPRPVAQPLIQEEPNPLQAHTVRAAKYPEYFFTYKEHPDQADFLGACVYGKVSWLPPRLTAPLVLTESVSLCLPSLVASCMSQGRLTTSVALLQVSSSRRPRCMYVYVRRERSRFTKKFCRWTECIWILPRTAPHPCVGAYARRRGEKRVPAKVCSA